MTATAAEPAPTYLKDYTPPAYKVQDIHLTFRIQDGYTEVTSHTTYLKNHDGAQALVLNGECMELLSLSLNGKILQEGDYKRDDKSLTLPCPGAEFTLEITTKFDPAANTALEGLYKSGGTYCTQCEAEGFRRITYFQDRPDVMTVFTTRIEADKAACPVLLSNGNLIEEGSLDGERHYAVWNDPFPKPCYLFALVAGDLTYIQDHFVTMTDRKVDLRIYVRKGDEGQCGWAMEALKKSMKWDEEKFGREYQLDRFNIVAVSDFNMGAMENTSLNIFNTAYILAHPETSTDRDFYNVESVVAHEYFHNWTGNRVTCRDWFQLSLKEGFTVFRDQEFSSDLNSRAVQRIDDVQALRSMQFPEDGGPLAHPVRPDSYIEINNFYTMTVYEKGAEVVRMQKTLLGPEKFRAATDLYFDRFDGQAVTCDDFTACMMDAGQIDLAQFKLWYSQAGTPEITAKGHYDEAAQTYKLTLSQSVPLTPGQPNKKPMHIPIAIGLLNDNGDEILSTQILNLTDKSEDFIFEKISSRPVPSILRNFSAPVRLITDLSEDDLRFLMVHDTDGFNRWEAAQNLSLRMINRMLDQVEAGHHTVTDRDYLKTVSMLLEQGLDGNQDKALLARMLALPDYSSIAQERRVVDPEAIYAVTTKISRDILTECGKLLGDVYTAHRSSGVYSPDPASMARRSLKASALKFITAANDEVAADTAYTLYQSADNMTDRMMALSNLMDSVSPLRDNVLEDFYNRFQAYPLVLDKWFAVQAKAVRAATLDDLKILTTHPDFTLKNPNRARSIYSAFAMLNPVTFHRADGKGYEFFGDAVCAIDPINPQVASRLLTAVRDWRRYSPARQDMIRAQLERILSRDNLSPNSYEIASKILAS
jgi:aminopeptidase N